MASAFSGVSTMKALKRPRFFDRGDMRLGEFDGGNFLLGKALARFGERQLGELGHRLAHSTTLGTTKK